MLIRAQEMARYVEHGALDVGLTDAIGCWKASSKWSQSRTLCMPSKVGEGALVLAVPEDSPGSIRRTWRTARLLPSWWSDAALFRGPEHSCQCGVFLGATEIKPPTLADAIVEVTETGSSLRANRLRIIDTVLESNTQLVANVASAADPEKRQKITTWP